MSGSKVAGYSDPVDYPQDWDKAVSAAYLRLIGNSQKGAARGAGVGERTLHRWEQCSWFEDAREEARERWLNDLVAEARATLFNAIREGDAENARKILERMDADLVPPAHRHEHTGEGGGPIEYRNLTRQQLQQKAWDLQNRLQEHLEDQPSTNGKQNGRRNGDGPG